MPGPMLSASDSPHSQSVQPPSFPRGLGQLLTFPQGGQGPKGTVSQDRNDPRGAAR